MNTAAPRQLGLPAADQIGFVVKDLEESMVKYQPLFGPFHTMDASIDAADFRGKNCDAKLKLAFGKSGDLEIELIQWIEGVFHEDLAYCSVDIC